MREDNGSSQETAADPSAQQAQGLNVVTICQIAENGGAPATATETEDDKRRQSHKKRSKNWTRQETLRLIRLRSEFEPRFARSGRKSDLWDEISAALQTENICRDAQQCRDKWEKLTAGYKEVRDGVKNRHDNPFFDELHPLLSARDRKDNRTLSDAAETMAVTTAVVNPVGVSVNGVNDNKSEDDDGERTEDETPARKRSRCRYLTATEVDNILENLFLRQQRFFAELLDSMERREQIRDQIRQEKEDRWRAEERAQRCTLDNAMILLTRKLLEQQQKPPEPSEAAGAGAGAAAVNNPKKRSKNWKRAEVLRLIKFRGEMEAKFVGSSRRAALWDGVAGFLAREGIRRDGKQCREKWDKLMAEHKEVVDGKREPRDSPYFAELTAIFFPPPPPPSSAADVASSELQEQENLDHLDHVPDPQHEEQLDIL